MQNGIQFTGDTFETKRIIAINRTGSALLVGGVYALDLSRVQAETTDARTALTNVTPVAAANIDGILVIATDTTADNEQGDFIVEGPCKALVDGTTDVLVADKLIAAAASSSLVKSGATTDNVQGLALAGQTANSAVLTDIFFNGFGMAKPGTAS